MKKKLMSLVGILMMVFAFLPCVVKAETMDYSDEPIIFGTEYEGELLEGGEEHADTYLLNVPVDGKVFFEKYWCSEDRTLRYVITNVSTKERIELSTSQGSGFNTNKPSDSTYLKRGKYSVTCYISNIGGGVYHFTVNYKPTIPTTAKVSSPSKGSLKVSMPKGTGTSGYEIQYKSSGDWKTKEVKLAKNLNTTITGLKSGKYSVRVRKVVEDSYGYVYYSDWTTKQSVSVKKK